jgi:hypothetical protein
VLESVAEHSSIQYAPLEFAVLQAFIQQYIGRHMPTGDTTHEDYLKKNMWNIARKIDRVVLVSRRVRVLHAILLLLISDACVYQSQRQSGPSGRLDDPASQAVEYAQRVFDSWEAEFRMFGEEDLRAYINALKKVIPPEIQRGTCPVFRTLNDFRRIDDINTNLLILMEALLLLMGMGDSTWICVKVALGLTPSDKAFKVLQRFVNQFGTKCYLEGRMWHESLGMFPRPARRSTMTTLATLEKCQRMRLCLLHAVLMTVLKDLYINLP